MAPTVGRLSSSARSFDDPTKGIRFAAVNFYHKKPLIDKDEVEVMIARLRARGLGWIIDASPGMHMVDQQSCVDKQDYPAQDADPSWCGQKGSGLSSLMSTTQGSSAELVV